MRIQKVEYHQMSSYFTYDIDEETIVEDWGSVDEFLKHFEEESDEFYEYMSNCDYDREDDLWTDRKGGYDIEWSIEEE